MVSIQTLRSEARLRLSDTRYDHTLGCARLAAELAGIYGCDPLNAECAGLLHDITRELPDEAHLYICKKSGILINNDFETSRIFLHAITAAVVAEDEFGMPPEVLSAIRRHTVGASDMSMMDKIVYVADAVEETRKYADAARLCALARVDLDAALLEVAEFIIIDNIRKGHYIHPHTLAARNNVWELLCKKNVATL